MSESGFAPVRSVPLVTQVAGRFRGLITDGTWSVGTRIPGESRLALDLGVSRGTVREALRALTLAGLLDPRVGDGTYVRSDDELTSLLQRDLGNSDLAHALDVRRVLESAAAARAATHATPGHVAAMLAALDDRTTAAEAGDTGGYVLADTQFHRAVADASGNPLLARIYDALAVVMADSIKRTTVLPEDPSLGRLHADLADAIVAGQAFEAERLAGELIGEVVFSDAQRRSKT